VRSMRDQIACISFHKFSFKFWFSFVESRFSNILHTQAVLACCYVLEDSRAAISFLKFPILLPSLFSYAACFLSPSVMQVPQIAVAAS